MDFNQTNWQAVFYDFLVWGIILFAIFRLLRLSLPVLLKDYKKVIGITRYLPLVETIGWLLFFSWYTFRFFEIGSVYGVVIIIVLLIFIFFLSRFFLKDLIAGMVFRTSGRFKTGDLIEIDNTGGKVKRFHFDNLEIESEDGKKVFIPYGKILESINIKSESEEQITVAFKFSIICKKPENNDDLIREVKSFILALPWSSINNKPEVQLSARDKETVNLEITAFPVDKSFSKKIENQTLDRFKGLTE